MQFSMPLDLGSCGDADVLAIDCEMVGIAAEGSHEAIRNALCRVSLVSVAPRTCHHKRFSTLLDAWVRVDEEIVDFRSRITGVDAKTFAQKPSMPFAEVRQIVSSLIAGKIVVGHAVHNDFEALRISHPESLLRDTSTQMSLLPPGRHTTPSLKLLAEYWLNESMHSGVHDSVQDATIALRLYMMHALEWEKAVIDQVAPCCTTAAGGHLAPWLWGLRTQAAGVWVPWPLPKIDGICGRAVNMDHNNSLDAEKQPSNECAVANSSAAVDISAEKGEVMDCKMHGPSQSPASSVPPVHQVSEVDLVETAEASKPLRPARECRTSNLTSDPCNTLPTVVPDFWAEATPMSLTFISSCLVVFVIMLWQTNPKHKEVALKTLAFELFVWLFRAALAFSSGWAFGPFCTELLMKAGASFRSTSYECLCLVHAEIEQRLWSAKNHKL